MLFTLHFSNKGRDSKLFGFCGQKIHGVSMIQHTSLMNDIFKTTDSVHLAQKGGNFDRSPFNKRFDRKYLYELERIRSFSEFPRFSRYSALLLARQGFVYQRNEKCDKIGYALCIFCSFKLADLYGSVDVEEVHRRVSPQCPLVTGEGSCNQSMPVEHEHSFESILLRISSLEKNREKIELPPSTRYLHEVDESVSSGSNDHEEKDSSVAHYSTDSVVFSPHRDETRPSAVNSGTAQVIADVALPVTGAASAGEEVSDHSAPQPTIAQPPRPDMILQSAGPLPSPTGTTSLVAPQSNSSLPSTESDNSPDHLDQDGGFSAEADSTASSPSDTEADSTAPLLSDTEADSNAPLPSDTEADSNAPLPSDTEADSNVQSPSDPQPGDGNAPSTSDKVVKDPRTEKDYLSKLGIVTSRPKRPEYAVEVVRLQSFHRWPADHHIKVDDLVQAGYFFTGYGDCARCFSCAGGLRNWELNDNVWVEHARWFPACSFMKQTVGIHFINTVQELKKQHEVITYEDVISKMRVDGLENYIPRDASFALEHDPAVKSVILSGYNKDDVLREARTLQDKGEVLSSDVIYKELTKHAIQSKSSSQSQFSKDSKDVRKCGNDKKDEEIIEELKEENYELRQLGLCKICMDKEVSVVFLPCGHFVACNECSFALTECPVCRVSIKGVIRAFLS